MPAIKLTPKQRAFVDQYVLCRSGAEAARRAGFAISSARITASQLLTKPNVKAALALKEAELRRAAKIDRNYVVQEILTGIAVAKQNMRGGEIISGWMHLACLLGLVAPDVKTNSKGLSAENKVIQAKMALLSDAELTEIVEGRVTI